MPSPLKSGTLRIQPCILVIDRLTVERAVSYVRTDHVVQANPDKSEDATWKTERHYMDRDEAKEADRVYSRARTKIRSVCSLTDIGFIALAAKDAELQKAISEARQIVDDGNKTFKHCKVNFRVVCTKIEPDNVDGAATLAEAINKSIDVVRSAMTSLDVKKARDTLSATKGLVDVISDPEAQAALTKARDESKTLLNEIQVLLKDFDGNVANALASQNGQAVLARGQAIWNF
jgi:hypothetical protein